MRSQTLVSTEELATHLDDPHWVVLDCRFDLADPAAGQRSYEAGHVPGAHFADLDQDLARRPGPGEGRHPLPDAHAFRHRVAQWGVGPDSQVVVYDDSGGGFAARAWWMLRWIGHSNVALLDGGFGAWLASNGAMSTDTPDLALGEPGAEPRAGDDWVTPTVQVDAALAAGARLIDARAPERFHGHSEPIDPVAGHIPGALNYPFTDSLGPDGLFRSAEEITARLEQVLGPRSGTPVIAMCGSGVTACHLLLSMEIAGLEGARLYAGSWSEWITDPARPVATGPAKTADA